jgi:hypothetical protein
VTRSLVINLTTNKLKLIESLGIWAIKEIVSSLKL